MKNLNGVPKKVLSSHAVAHKRGGWRVEILECKHAILLGASQEKLKERRCGLCAVDAKKRGAGAIQTLQQILKKYDPEEVLRLLVEREAKRNALKKARAVLAEKRTAKPAPLALAAGVA